MTIPFGHHQLHNRYHFQGLLELATPLRVSSGRADEVTEAPVIRYLDGTPYIPGSSLRGTLRSQLERIITAAGPVVAGLSSCTLFEDNHCATLVEACKREQEKSKKPQKEKDEEIMKYIEEILCDVCRLFGSAVYASRLVIADALPVALTEAKGKINLRDGLGIDRDTGAARAGVKFDYQVIETGPRFWFQMTAENVQDQDRKLIDLILALLKDGLYVGGKRAGGLGLIRLQPDYQRPGEYFQVCGFKDPANLWERLINGQDLDQPLTWEEHTHATPQTV